MKSSFQNNDRKGIEHEAAQWTLRLQQGLTAEEWKQLESWLAEDERHAEVLGQMGETSQLLDRFFEAEPIRSISQETPSPLVRRWLLPASIGGLAAMLTIAGGLWLKSPGPAVSSYARSLATETTGSRSLDLPDGSIVQLNADSSVEIRYERTERRVRLLRGEAFFAVAKNQARPFYVEVGGLSVRAVGTAFNVRYGSDHVEVLVTEGKVRVDDRVGHSILPPEKNIPANQTEERLLVAGEKAEVPSSLNDAPRDSRGTVVLLAPEGIETALAWRERPLEFSSEPLSEVAAEFNRHNAHKIVIADQTLAAQRFGGTFAPHDYDAFVEALEQGFGVNAERRAGETILRKAR